MNDLKKCFKRGLLRKVEPSDIKSRQSLKEGDKWLRESVKNLNSGAYSSAQLTTYLVVFHAARAVLFRDGVREKSHYCIGIYLDAYNNMELLEERWPLLFDRMRSTRHAGQYSFQIEPSQEEVESGIKSAKDFIIRIRKLIEENKRLILEI